MSRAAPPTHPPTPVLQTIRQSHSYPPQTESLIADHIAQTTHRFPTLHATTSMFTSPQGTSQRLVALRGTVPVQYRNATYKIPVHIWLMPYHPSGPPVIFVVPTRAMVFRKGHPHVDASNGLVYLPYLSEWNARSTLVDAVAALAAAFSVKPPVYARPGVATGAETERRAVIERLTGRLRVALREGGERKVAEVKLMREMNERLLEVKRRECVEGGEEGLRRYLGELEGRRGELKRWLGEREEEGVDGLRYRYALQEQEVECRARDMALGDALGVLDRCVGGMEVGEWVVRVRGVAREMFFERVLLRRIRKRVEEVKRGRVERRASLQEGRREGGGVVHRSSMPVHRNSMPV